MEFVHSAWSNNGDKEGMRLYMEIILGKTAGFCYGVNRAVEGCKKVLEENKEKSICCLGEIVHNKTVVEDLKKDGIKFIDNISDVKGITIIRAHGVPKAVYEEAEKNNVEIKDFTCPNVLKIHDIAKKYTDKGYFIVLCGDKKHPENIGTLSYCGKNVYVVNNDKDVFKALEVIGKSGIKKVLLISQTTFSVEKYFIIREILGNELNRDIEFVSENTICNATELRQDETKKIASDVDFMIIIGGKNSSNTQKLFDIAKSNCKNTVCIENVDDLDISNIKSFNKIGIMAGASTPKKDIDEVINKIEK